jgi:hypothetical protein
MSREDDRQRDREHPCAISWQKNCEMWFISPSEISQHCKSGPLSREEMWGLAEVGESQ